MRITLLAYFLILIISCKPENTADRLAYQKISGKTMGTYYNITLETDGDAMAVQGSLDSILNDFENELSTYRPSSTISTFNQSNLGICLYNKSYFAAAILKAKEIYQLTGGSFDPTIAPLVNFYGFGYTPKAQKDQSKIDSAKALLSLVGMDRLGIEEQGDSLCINKTDPNQLLDLSASAKGLGVDICGKYLESLGVINYLVEIGGEVRARGINSKGKTWTLGINKPTENASVDEILLPITLENKSMATSGNYRNFYKDGKLTFAHIINPNTGLSQPTDILSATVIADDCETADGIATALMVMGLDKAKRFSDNNSTISTCLIFYDSKSDSLGYFYSQNFKK